MTKIKEFNILRQTISEDLETEYQLLYNLLIEWNKTVYEFNKLNADYMFDLGTLIYDELKVDIIELKKKVNKLGSMKSFENDLKRIVILTNEMITKKENLDKIDLEHQKLLISCNKSVSNKKDFESYIEKENGLSNCLNKLKLLAKKIIKQIELLDKIRNNVNISKSYENKIITILKENYPVFDHFPRKFNDLFLQKLAAFIRVAINYKIALLKHLENLGEETVAYFSKRPEKLCLIDLDYVFNNSVEKFIHDLLTTLDKTKVKDCDEDKQRTIIVSFLQILEEQRFILLNGEAILRDNNISENLNNIKNMENVIKTKNRAIKVDHLLCEIDEYWAIRPLEKIANRKINNQYMSLEDDIPKSKKVHKLR